SRQPVEEAPVILKISAVSVSYPCDSAGRCARTVARRRVPMFRRTSIDSSIRATTPSNELIVKVKADVPTRRALQHLVLAEGTGDRTFAAAVPREAAFVPSTSALEMLVLSGAIESVEPLFDSPGIRRAAGSERLAFAVEPSGVGEEDTLHILTFRDEDAAEHAC